MSKDKALPPDNHLKSVKMAVEGNMNMLDGIINDEPPKTDAENRTRLSIYK